MSHALAIRTENPVPTGLLLLGAVALVGGVIWLMTRDDAEAVGSVPPSGSPLPGQPGPNGLGTVWSPGGIVDPSDLADFDFAGAGLWVSPDCQTVFEGEKFWGPAETSMAPTPTQALYSTPTGVTPGIQHFLAYARFAYQNNNARTLADLIINDLAPDCYKAEQAEWSAAMWSWYDSLVNRIQSYISLNEFVPRPSTIYFLTAPGYEDILADAQATVTVAGLPYASVTAHDLAPYSNAAVGTLAARELVWVATPPDPLSVPKLAQIYVPPGEDPAGYDLASGLQDLIAFAKTGQEGQA